MACVRACLWMCLCEHVFTVGRCSGLPTPTSPRQPGLPLIDAQPLPHSASLQRRPPGPSQTTRDSLFVIYELVCGFGYEKRGAGPRLTAHIRNGTRNKPGPLRRTFRLAGRSLALVYYSRFSRRDVDMEEEMAMTVEKTISEWVEWTSLSFTPCFSFFPVLPPHTGL